MKHSYRSRLVLFILPLVIAALALTAACTEAPSSATAGPAVTGGSQAENPTQEPEITPEPTPSIRYAGEDTKIVRDGTPKKYFTLSFDDGITQDLKIIEILKKYNFTACTFNIDTGLLGVSWDWVADAAGKKGLKHIRFTEDELKTGIYDGYDVEVHTLTHPSLKNFDKNRVIKEVKEDADNIERIIGIRPVGMAWPGGDTEYTDETIKIVYENTDIRFGRGTTSTHNFKLPKYFLKWQPTCAMFDAQMLTLANKFLKAECTEDMLFYVWGHGYEFDVAGTYQSLERLVKMMSQAEDVVCVTNAEFYQLFKDQIPAWKDE